MMQRVLSQRALRRVAALRSVLLNVAFGEPPATVCSCVLRLPPGPRGLGTSAPGRAMQQPKQQPEANHQPSNPATQAGPHGSDPTTQVPGAEAGTEGPLTAHEEPVEIDPLQDGSIGLVQRFKKTFKQHGKVMIPVHLLTSSVWFGTFYYAAMKGVNVVPFLELVGLPESIVGLLRDSQSGYALTAYAMYKIATPARYTMTLGGTSVSVQYLRKHGYLSTPPPVKEYIQDKMEETREKLSEKMEETKERFSEKMEETKELLSETKERFEETKDKFSEKIQETKDKVSFRKTDKTKRD